MPKITKIQGLVVVTGKHDSVVRTPFGSFTVESHEAGIEAALAYIARHA